MNPDNAIGQRVRQRRRSLDLTQEELARRVGCAASPTKSGYGTASPIRRPLARGNATLSLFTPRRGTLAP
jgi:transcriptional regulator with XRE-family HTH domain